MCLKTFIILTLNIKVRKLNSNMLNENVSMLVEQHKKTLTYICTSAISKIQRDDHRTVKPISNLLEVQTPSVPINNQKCILRQVAWMAGLDERVVK